VKAHQVAERRVSSRALVGRGPERAALAEAIAAAGAGEPVVVLVGGEAGVGKTRLTGEAAITARDRGALVLRGASVEMTAGELPYGPLVAALRDLPRDPEHPRADDIRTVRRELGERLTGEAGGSLDPDQGQAHVFETLLRALRRLARRGTLVLLLEDVHWADASTLDFLRFLVRNLGSEPLAAIATYRSDEADRPVRGLLADLIRAPAVRRLTLAPLTADDVRAQA
jgi:predicted ATPase